MGNLVTNQGLKHHCTLSAKLYDSHADILLKVKGHLYNVKKTSDLVEEGFPNCVIPNCVIQLSILLSFVWVGITNENTNANTNTHKYKYKYKYM